ncbi:hypothetical protein J8L70_08015 [Pseudoalteromonas sp. MMG010]|uniref:hypothetical protein n=1 Tax=Pseudoalteromonas sp. MMG010 TaxID=2822685 RepID=UPI001B3A1E77|nr:hypothetical protein [Pseudoalteromonas sp. MMG010]MBQ4833183.1 hypothetical protein [Pseudoalteromonas sp. MMG010]
MRSKITTVICCLSLLFTVSCGKDNKNSADSEKTLLQSEKQTKLLPPISHVEPSIVNGLVASHCNNDEISYMNAKMHDVIAARSVANTHDTQDIYKVLSICLSQDNTKMFYRYGQLGAIESMSTANNNTPFAYYIRKVNGINETILFFTQHDYRYYIMYSDETDSGVNVKIYHGQQLISELSSGTEAYQDYVVANNIDIPTSLMLNIRPPNAEMQ